MKYRDTNNDFIVSLDLLKRCMEAEQEVYDGAGVIVYDDYLSSGLINEKLLRFEQEEYLNIINEYIEIFGNAYDVMIKKVDILIKMNNNEEALLVLKSISKHNRETIEQYFYKLKALYNIKENDEVIILAEKIKNSDINIPDKYIGIIQFWT